MENWSSAQTARKYDEWTRRFPMYRQTSADLVRVAGIAPGDHVVDLCCGTGVTSEEVLRVVGPGGRLWSVDGSEAMLEIARRNLTADNVTFHCCPAESFHLGVEGAADAVVCNSAFWQTDNVQVLASARRVLREGGRFAFNLGSGFYKFEDQREGPTNPWESPFYQRMIEIAVDEYGYALPTLRRFGNLQLRGYEEWRALLNDNGFEVLATEITPSEATAESEYEWLRIPIFSTRLLPGLPYDVKMAIHERAYREVPPEPPTPGRWIHLVAELTGTLPA